ncbi:hypothetical protein HC928_09210 [bacterium]|nr:hypothetical protein [bacterium]
MTSIDLEHRRLVAGVRFTKLGKLYHFDYAAFPDLQAGDYVIVETARGRQMGQIIAFTSADDSEREHKPILRAATPRDLILKQEWEALQPEALTLCQDKADEIGHLDDVKFVAAQYNYDGTMLTFCTALSRR